MKYSVVMSALYTLLFFVNLEAVYAIASYGIADIAAHPVEKYLWMIGIYLLAYLFFRILTNRMSNSGETLRIFKANLLAAVVIFSILFIAKQGEAYSRFIVTLFFILNMLIPLYILGISRLLFRLPWLRERILIVGDDEGVDAVREWLTSEFFGFDTDEVQMHCQTGMDQIVSQLGETAEKSRYYAVAIAVESLPVDEVFRMTEMLQHHFSRVIIVPNLGMFPLINADIIGSIGGKGVAFSVPNKLLNPYERVLKNGLDYLLSVIILILTLPLFGLLYILVFLSSGGYPVFTQSRIGRNGNPFNIYKFTSMRRDADRVLESLLENDPEVREEWERDHKLKDDPRITRFGHILRKTSLDELPQLFNILKGEMSLVGPRPIVQEEIEKYEKDFYYFSAVKPGITGLWQVSGRSDVDYAERVRLDVWYVRNWSVDLDLLILMKTVGAVLRKTGSY